MREIVVAPKVIQNKIDGLKNTLDDQPLPLRASLLAQIGSHYRCLEKLEESENCLRKALEVFNSLKRIDAQIVTSIRLALTLHSKKKWTESEELYLNCIKKIESSQDSKVSSLLDFAYYNYARFLFEQKRYKTSLDFFIKALELRLIKGDIELINNTQIAINRLKELID